MNQEISQLLPSPLFSGLFWVILRTSAVYLVLVVGLRVCGKRNMGQMSLTDLVFILLISNSVQNAMVGPDESLLGGLTAALTLMMVNRSLDSLSSRSERLARALIGSPTLLVNDGEFVETHLRKEGLSHEEVMMAIREHGVERLHDVRMAVLEVDGSISIVPQSVHVKRTHRHFQRHKRDKQVVD
jgi:uncharacterized membrane protein YcaP (DUF421 family)